jgi:hypothetical protein
MPVLFGKSRERALGRPGFIPASSKLPNKIVLSKQGSLVHSENAVVQ